MQSLTDLTSRDSKPTLTVDQETFDRDPLFSPPHHLARRSFIRSLGIGAALLVPGAALLGATRDAFSSPEAAAGEPPTRGDIAILRFLAAAELLEQDFWQQYSELADGNTPYK